MRVPSVYLIAGGAVALALLWAATKGAKGTGAAIVGGAVDLVDGALGEGVNTVGEAVGIPRTNVNECQRRIEEFRRAPWYEKTYLSFGVSAYCPAGDYLRFAATGKGPLDK